MKTILTIGLLAAGLCAAPAIAAAQARTPAAAAQSTALGHENRALVGSNGETLVLSLRTERYTSLMSRSAIIAVSVPMRADSSCQIRFRPITSVTRREGTS